MSTNKTFNKVQLDVKFTQAASRANLISEENISISFGKISKYFADLHSEAFTGYTHPTYTARTGKPTGNQTPGFGSTFTISQITSDGTGHVTAATDRTVKIPDTTMGAATADTAGSIGLVPAPAAGKQSSFLRGDGTWVVPTNTDTKVTDTVGTANTYYPAGGTSTSTATGTQVFDTSFKFIGTTGTTSAVGKAQLVLGNATASGTVNNKQGSIVVYGSTAYAHTIQGVPTAARTLTLPDKTGTFALTSDIPSVPTVNDAALTLKGAGTTVTTFTANASSAKSLDIVAGSNVTVTADATNAKISIASSHSTITKSTDTTSTASPAHGGTFTTVDTVTRDEYGHVTKINTKTVTLPSDQNTDTLVSQTFATASNKRPLLMSYYKVGEEAGTAQVAYRNDSLYCNPSNGRIFATGFYTNGWDTSPASTSASLQTNGLILRAVKTYGDGHTLNYNRYVVRTYSGKTGLSTSDWSSSGMLVTIEGGGLTIVGGGESASSLAGLISDDYLPESGTPNSLDVNGDTTTGTGYLHTSFSGSSEHLILSADVDIYFVTNAGTIANRKAARLTSDLYFTPLSTNTGSIGTSTYQWNTIYGKTLYENGTSLGSKYAAIGHTHSDYVLKTGDTMSGNLTLSKSSGGAYYYAERTDTGVEVMFGVGTGGTNHGIYSNKLGKWMMYGDASNVYLNGNATTASSWATARTLTLGGQLTGSVSVKGDTNMTLSGYLKNTLIHDDTSDFASYAWHKFAEVDITTANSDQTITFIVSKTWGQVPGFSGILTAHVRVGSTKIYESAQFQWNLAGTSINPDDFVLVYTDTANTSCKVELWYKQNARYDGWVFTILKEHGRSNVNNVWTVYTASGHGSATYTAGTGTVTSTIADIKNDKSVLQSNTATSNYRPIMFGTTNTTTIADLSATVTGQAYVSSQMFAKPSIGYLYATCFSTTSYLDGTGAQLSSKGLYLKSVGEENTGTKYSFSRYAVRTYPGKLSSSDGMLLEICGGGLTIVGSGESATNLAALIDDDQTVTSPARLNVGGTLNTSLTGSSEQLILSSDNSIYFITKCNTIANRMPVVLDNNSYFHPGTNKTGSIGTSSYMWNSVYAATIYENGSSLESKYGLNNQIYALNATSDTADFNGVETLITSLPSSSGTSTPSYQRISINGFIKKVISDLKEPVLYSNTTNPTASATVSFNTNLGTPKYLKLFITVDSGSTYNPSSGVTNIVDVDPLQYANGCFVGHGSPGQYGVSTYLTYICIIHSESSGRHTYSCVKGSSLQLSNDNLPSTISACVYVTKVVAVY